MLSALASRARSEHGFTFIELLVIVLIVGVLSTIALPAFLGHRAKAADGSAQSQVRNAATANEMFRTENGRYADSSTELSREDPSISSARPLEVEGTVDTFRIASETADGRVVGIEKVTGGAIRRFCSPAGAGTCAADGTW